jgi:Ni/Fe-hydrogenase subunit HybB-like protein
MSTAQRTEIKLFTPTTIGLIMIMMAGGLIILYRYAFGLGAATNMNDEFPWGIWIGFDILGGVAMAAGGFVIASAVYLLNMKKYKPIARPAILTAFLGYFLAVCSLLVDLGQPHRIWHPMVMWQVQSVMFIVALHVTLYTTTLALESSPMLLEKIGMERAKRVIDRSIVGIALFGTLLSTLHQSSLGAVYLIAAGKLHPLWYSSTLPFSFLVSAVMMGLNMVSFESIMSSKFFKHKANMEILRGLARGSLITMAFYLALKLYLLVTGPGIAAAFDGTMEANLYLVEMGLLIVPMGIILVPRFRSSMGGLTVINVLVVAGVLLNRMNVSWFGMLGYARSIGGRYVPSWMEVGVTLTMIAFGALVFKVAVKYLNVLHHGAEEESAMAGK